MNKKKGFTLTEILVTMVILGIITGLSIPLIRNLSVSFEKKKYKTYSDSVTSSAKLYNDSYGEDLFGHNQNGCAYVTYAQLKEKNLLKDIDVSDMSCDSSSTFVRILKIGDHYSYKTFLGCGEKKDGKASDVNISLPEPNKVYEMNSEYCTGTDDNNLLISALIGSDAKDMNKKQKKTRLTITSATGINRNVVIYTAWSKDKNGYSQANFTKKNFEIPGNQKGQMEQGNIIEANSNEILTPANETGTFYLLVRVDNLKDYYGSNWKNPNGTDSKYISFGPFVIDNTPPTQPIVLAYKKKNATDIKTNSGLQTINTDTWYSGYEFIMPTGSTDNSNKPVTYYYTISGTETASNQKGSYKNINNEGTTKIKFKACDIAGNCSSYTDVFTTKLDRTAPTCGTATNATTAWTINNRTIKQACSDSISKCEKNSYDTTYTTTTKTSSVTIKDKAGNTKKCSYNVYVDKTAPTCGTATNSSTSWTNQNKTIKQACKDTDSGCAKTSYDKTYTASTKTGSVIIKDKVGNTRTCSYNVYLDKDAPTCGNIDKLDNANGSDYGSGSHTCNNVYTSAACTSDAGGSGCSSNKILTTRGATTNITNEPRNQWTVEAGGTSYITWAVYDNAGNATACSTVTVNKGTYTASSACGCKRYNSCQTSACGTTSSKTYAWIWVTQAYCQNSITANGKRWYLAGSTPSANCSSAIGNKTGQGCCYYYRNTTTTATCENSACGCAEYNTCCQ